MKKVVICLLTFLLFVAIMTPATEGSRTGNYLIGATGRGPQYDTFDDVLFWLNSEVKHGGVISSYSAGDQVPRMENSVDFADEKFHCTGFLAFARFDVVDEDLIDGTSGRIGFWFKLAGNAADQGLFRAGITGAAAQFYIYTAAGNELQVVIKDGVVPPDPYITTGANLVAGNDYFIEVMYDISDPLSTNIEIIADGVSIGTHSWTGPDAYSPIDFDRFYWGSMGPAWSESWFDTMIISNDKDRDLYVLRNLKYYPGNRFYPDITFWWNAEAPMVAPHSYSAGDKVGTASGGATLEPQGKIGNDTHHIDGTNDYFEYDLTEGIIIDGSKGKIGFWLDVDTYPSSAQYPTIFEFENTGGDSLRAELTGTTIEFYYGPTHSASAAFSGSEYEYLEFEWDTTIDTPDTYIKIYVNGQELDSSVGSVTGLSFLTGTLRIGNARTSATAFDMDLDLFSVSDNPERDFYALSTNHYYPGYFLDEWFDIRFCWRCEGMVLDPDLDYNLGTDPHSTGAAVITPVAKKVGENGLRIFLNDAYVQFDSELNQHMNVQGSKIGYWWKPVTWGIDQWIWHLATNATVGISMRQILPHILFPQVAMLYGDIANQIDGIATYAPGNWFYVEQGFYAPNNLGIFASFWKNNGLDKFALAFYTQPWSVIDLNLGNIGPNGGDYYMDNIVISSDSQRRLYPIRCYERCPTWAPTAREWEEDWLIFWRVEASTMVIPNNDYTTYPINLVWAIGGTATITSSAGKVGTNGLRTTGATSYALYDPGPDEEAFDIHQGRIGFWWRAPTWDDNASLFSFVEDGNNSTGIYITSSNNIGMWSKDGGVTTNITSVDTIHADKIREGVWYFIEYAYNTCLPYRAVYVNGRLALISHEEFEVFDVTPDIYIGNVLTTGTSSVMDFDNIMLSDEHRRILYDFRFQPDFGG